MATKLASQLAQIAAKSTASLNIKAQKAAHSKSLIWEPREAATQNYEDLYNLCHAGFDELCHLDRRFGEFETTIFSKQSRSEDRTQLTEAENDALNHRIDDFLRLVGRRLQLMPAIKAVEWLIRRFRIHEFNSRSLLTTFLPWHTLPVFVTLLSILPKTLPQEYAFLLPYTQALKCPPRSIIVRESIRRPSFISLLSEYTLQSCRQQQHYQELLTFWGGITSEALSGMIDELVSGRAALQGHHQQKVFQLFGPILAEALSMKKVPGIQVAAYMAVSILAAKGDMGDEALTALMEQVAHGVGPISREPGLLCLAILAEFFSGNKLSRRVIKPLLKVPRIDDLLINIGRKRRVDKLATGVCLAYTKRLHEKGESQGLATVKSILLSQILTEPQTVAIVKALLSLVSQLNDQADETGDLRTALGATLVDIAQSTGKQGEIIRAAIQDANMDIEELEMTLDISSQRLALEKRDETKKPVEDQVSATSDVERAFIKLSEKAASLAIPLTSDPETPFDDIIGLFLSLVRNTEHSHGLQRFEQLPLIRRQSAASDGTYFNLMVRIWCGPYPALARDVALVMAKSRLSQDDCLEKDFQGLLPYCIAALGDPSQRIRRSAADLVAVLASGYHTESGAPRTKSQYEWLYDNNQSFQWPESQKISKILQAILLPALEECVIDEGHIEAVLRDGLDNGGPAAKTEANTQETKKSRSSHSLRSSLLAFLAQCVVQTQLLMVKTRLLRALNAARTKSSTTTESQLLLQALQWWSSLSEDDAKRRIQAEKLDGGEVDSRFVEVVPANATDGLQCLLDIIKSPLGENRQNLSQCIFAHLRSSWPSMKEETRSFVAHALLNLSQDTKSTNADAAAELLRNVELSTSVLSAFLDFVLIKAQAMAQSPPAKRRRTSSTDSSGVAEPNSAAEALPILKQFTFILQVVEGSSPQKHPKLLEPLFSTLSAIQHFKVALGADLGYLQNLILRSLLNMMTAYQEDKSLKINGSRTHGDLLVKCIQQSSSPTVQNSAFLLIARLAATAPDMVIHSVMPIFTFMGGSVMRLSDDFSAYVVSQTIREVLPPLMSSIRRSKRNPVAGASELLQSFIISYEHVPQHRKHAVFFALLHALGPGEFLFAIIAMLVDKYSPSTELISFLLDLMNHFSVEVQLETLVKWRELIGDLFKPKPGLSSALLGQGRDDGQKEDPKRTAATQLNVFPRLILGKGLKLEIGQIAKEDDMKAAKVRELYSTLLENVLQLADTVKADKYLHDRCGASLANLLSLLSIFEFLKAVENLLNRPDVNLRQKVLKALEIRIDREGRSDAEARTALLSFLPELTAAIRNTSDVRHKHTAVVCIDKIAEKYGKKDLEMVTVVAGTIAGEHCLGQGDRRLRQIALVCLSTLVDVLQDSIVPVLPVAIPLTLMYLEQSLAGDKPEMDLVTACYVFLGGVAEHIPYVVSGQYLDQILGQSSASAEEELDEDAVEARTQCLNFVALQIEPKLFFNAMEKNWAFASESGYLATKQFLELLGIAIDKHSKGSIVKNTGQLSTIITKALDLRRIMYEVSVQTEEVVDGQKIAEIEVLTNEVGLKMIRKLNDAACRPVFAKLVGWASNGLSKQDTVGRNFRRQSLYSLVYAFFSELGSLVTSYALYIVDDAVQVLNAVDLASLDDTELWNRVMKTLAKSFEHDQDGFWQAPTHFAAVAPALVAQFLQAPTMDVSEMLVQAVTGLAAAADSQEHQKELNTSVLKHLRSEEPAVRLAAVKAEQALTQRLGEEWLAMLPEMLPYISELQEDDDETVERETHRWIVMMEGVLGESLDSMLQ
jgi:U3 small nucleolar RNA-associated protein 10